MSSLSHWITVRSGIAAFSTGTRRSSRPRAMTKPPTCCDRWRGKPISIFAMASQRCTPASSGSSPASAKRCGSSSRLSHQARLPARRRSRQRKAQRAAGVAQRAAGAVGDHGGGQRGAFAAVFGVDVLDHFLAPLVLEIDVDVGRLVALLRDEALEQHRGARRVDLGDAERVAHRRIGRRAAPLAQDALPARPGDDVVHGQEIGRVGHLGDQAQFVFDLRAHLVRHAGRIAPRAGPLRSAPQPGIRRLAGRHDFLRIFVAQFVEREIAARGDLQRFGQQFGRIQARQRQALRRWRSPLANSAWPASPPWC
jgi:hypothetical protein